MSLERLLKDCKDMFRTRKTAAETFMKPKPGDMIRTDWYDYDRGHARTKVEVWK